MHQLLSNIRTETQGAILVLASFVMLALLSCVGLAIDAGNLYRAKLAMQNAADAAALAGIMKIINVGPSAFFAGVPVSADPTFLSPVEKVRRDNTIGLYLDDLTRPVAVSNLNDAGYLDGHLSPSIPDSHYRVDFSSSYFSAGRSEISGDSVYEYRVTVGREIKMLLLDKLPVFGVSSNYIQARSASRRKIAAANLLLDHSASMGCPQKGPCTCLSDPKNYGACNGVLKVEQLADAVGQFLRMFDLSADRLGVVPFNSAAMPMTLDVAKELISQVEVLAGSQEDIADKIANSLPELLPPEGSTNICDALMRSAKLMDELLVGLGPGATAAHLLFTDGNPTAGRFLFSESARGAALPVWSPPEKDKDEFLLAADPKGPYDYSHHSLEWIDKSQNFYIAPSVLTQSGMIRFGHADAFPPLKGAANVGVDRADVAPCGPDVPPEVHSQEEAIIAANEVFGGAPGKECLRSLESHWPGAPNKRYGGNYGPRAAVSAVDKGFENWREMYYNCAIELGDYIREDRKETVHMVGLGGVDSVAMVDPVIDLQPGVQMASAEVTDPYLGFNPFYRNDIFGARVALDMKFGPEMPVEFNYAGYRSYNEWRGNNPEYSGIYLPTTEAGELRNLFRHIARKILLQLVEIQSVTP